MALLDHGQAVAGLHASGACKLAKVRKFSTTPVEPATSRCAGCPTVSATWSPKVAAASGSLRGAERECSGPSAGFLISWCNPEARLARPMNRSSRAHPLFHEHPFGHVADVDDVSQPLARWYPGGTSPAMRRQTVSGPRPDNADISRSATDCCRCSTSRKTSKSGTFWEETLCKGQTDALEIHVEQA